MLVADMDNEEVANGELDDPLENECHSDGRSRGVDVLIAVSWGKDEPQIVAKSQIVWVGDRQSKGV